MLWIITSEDRPHDAGESVTRAGTRAEVYPPPPPLPWRAPLRIYLFLLRCSLREALKCAYLYIRAFAYLHTHTPASLVLVRLESMKDDP